jgi:integrase
VKVDAFHKSEIEVLPEWWDAARGEIKGRIIMDTAERLRINRAVAERKALIEEVFAGAADGAAVTSEWLQKQINERLHPERYAPRGDTFFSAFELFIQQRPAGELRKKALITVMHTLQRFEKYKQLKGEAEVALTTRGFDEVMLRDFADFLGNEAQISKWYPGLYEGGIRPKQVGRGLNYIILVLKGLRSFFRWLKQTGRPAAEPFSNFAIPAQVYGTPYYLTIAERNLIYATDFPDRADLAAVRDVFVFQCMVGCRVGDLSSLTPHNVSGGVLEYIPRKTKEGRPVTVRVPLAGVAVEIAERYAGGATLLPVPPLWNYNAGIREVLARAGIRRVVTVLNSTTREEQHRPLCEIASSHLARRTFIGNLYKQVKDPNLIGALSGHSDGSQAFARYRQIDEEMRVELVRLLE